jgi:hypothetical protein
MTHQQIVVSNLRQPWLSYCRCKASVASTMSHMSPFTAGPFWPCSGPWQLKFGDHWLVVMILGVLEMASLHLRYYPILLQGFLHLTWVGIGLGRLFFAYSICWKCREHASIFTTKKLLISSFSLGKIHIFKPERIFWESEIMVELLFLARHD